MRSLLLRLKGRLTRPPTAAYVDLCERIGQLGPNYPDSLWWDLWGRVNEARYQYVIRHREHLDLMTRLGNVAAEDRERILAKWR